MINNFFKWFFSLFTASVVTLTPKPTPNFVIETALISPSPSPIATNIALEIIPSASPSLIPQTTSRPTISINNTPPLSGKYSKQSVKTDAGVFTVYLIAGDTNSTKIIVDTASASDCGNNCPVLSLSEYISRNSGWAGINGTYFCPKDYSTCSGKENTFDLLVMNKDKTYFNSSNNIYSTNPAVIFGQGYARFVTSGSQWGRDTGVNGVLMNYPLLVFNSNINFGGDSDPKKGSRGSRSFVANKGSTVYIGVTLNVTVAENALVMKALGMENALNLDSGGSTALWYGGYKVGPGRGIPNAIIFK